MQDFLRKLVWWGNKSSNAIGGHILHVKITRLIFLSLKIFMLLLQVFEGCRLNGLSICYICHTCIQLVIGIAQMSFNVDQIVECGFCAHNHVAANHIYFVQKLTLFRVFRSWWDIHVLLRVHLILWLHLMMLLWDHTHVGVMLHVLRILRHLLLELRIHRISLRHVRHYRRIRLNHWL